MYAYRRSSNERTYNLWWNVFVCYLFGIGFEVNLQERQTNIKCLLAFIRQCWTTSSKHLSNYLSDRFVNIHFLELVRARNLIKALVRHLIVVALESVHTGDLELLSSRNPFFLSESALGSYIFNWGKQHLKKMFGGKNGKRNDLPAESLLMDYSQSCRRFLMP